VLSKTSGNVCLWNAFSVLPQLSPPNTTKQHRLSLCHCHRASFSSSFIITIFIITITNEYYYSAVSYKKNFESIQQWKKRCQSHTVEGCSLISYTAMKRPRITTTVTGLRHNAAGNIQYDTIQYSFIMSWKNAAQHERCNIKHNRIHKSK